MGLKITFLENGARERREEKYSPFSGCYFVSLSTALDAVVVFTVGESEFE